MKDLKSVIRNKLWLRIWKVILIAAGAFLFGFCFQAFLLPNNIVSGGVTGVAMILNAFTHWPIGLMVIVMNIPLFLIAWRHFGLDYLLGSLLGMGLSSAAMDLFALTGIVLTREPMLASVIGGVIKGLALGMIYYHGASTGGIDIAAKLVRQRYSQLNFGTVVLIMDAVIILGYALIIGNYDSAMYSVIAMYVTTKVVDLVLYGLDTSCTCHIISEKSEALTRELTSGHMHRGVTILEGRGAYSHKPKHVILCVIKRNQIPELRRAIRELDENAFVIVTETKNVFGRGFENIAEVR